MEAASNEDKMEECGHLIFGGCNASSSAYATEPMDGEGRLGTVASDVVVAPTRNARRAINRHEEAMMELLSERIAENEKYTRSDSCKGDELPRLRSGGGSSRFH